MKKLPVVIGGGLGAFIGSSVGIAAMGTAFAGTVPLALLGAGAGWLWSRHKELQDSSDSSTYTDASESRLPTQVENGERIRKVCMTDREWIADRDQDCKENAVVCSRKIRAQIVHAESLATKILNGNDMWASGYVFGFSDAWMQYIGISKSDEERLQFLTHFYAALKIGDRSSDSNSPLRFALNSQGDQLFAKGMIFGGKDVTSLKEHGIAPQMLLKHLSSCIVGCRTCGQKLRVPKGKNIDATCPTCKVTMRLTT